MKRCIENAYEPNTSRIQRVSNYMDIIMTRQIMMKEDRTNKWHYKPKPRSELMTKVTSWAGRQVKKVVSQKKEKLWCICRPHWHCCRDSNILSINKCHNTNARWKLSINPSTMYIKEIQNYRGFLFNLIQPVLIQSQPFLPFIMPLLSSSLRFSRSPALIICIIGIILWLCR